MEINFQTHQKKEATTMKKLTKSKGRKRSNSSNNKFIGVRQRPSGRWVAEIKDTTQKIRMWLGTFETSEEAARAYDQAACLLRGSNTRTNFVTRVSTDSPLAYRIQNLLNSKKHAKKQGSSVFVSTNSSDDSSSPISIDDSSVSSEKIQLLEDDFRGFETLLNSCDEEIMQESQLFDNSYKPDLSNCSPDQEFLASPFSETYTFEASEFRIPDGYIEKSGNQESWFTSSKPEMSWSYGNGFEFAQELLEFPKKGNLEESTGEMGFTEFERMKVERQISASLYAVNGVQEYMESVHDPPADSLWDLPSLCSLLC